MQKLKYELSQQRHVLKKLPTKANCLSLNNEENQSSLKQWQFCNFAIASMEKV